MLSVRAAGSCGPRYMEAAVEVPGGGSCSHATMRPAVALERPGRATRCLKAARLAVARARATGSSSQVRAQQDNHPRHPAR